jgi:hypothetical protein
VGRGSALICTVLTLSLSLSAGALAQPAVDWALLRTKAVQVHLNLLIGLIEDYKVQHGTYPESLALLKASIPRMPVAIEDPPGLSRVAQRQPFFYRPVGTEGYYLRSLGEDGRVFTSDDIVPEPDTATPRARGLLLLPAL